MNENMRSQSPYSAREGRDTRNTADSICRNGGSCSMLKVTNVASGYRVGIIMGVPTDPTGG